MNTKFFITFVFALIFSAKVLADSPLTSIVISEAYESEYIIQQASKTEGKLTIELLNYLIDKKNAIELKIALINKLGWDMEGKNNASVFFNYLNDLNIISDMHDANAEILICYAYLKALDDYFNVEEAIEFAELAKSKNNSSYTISIICAIILAQEALDTNWCKVYNLTDGVRKDKSLDQDMKEETKSIIFEYMDTYKKYCQ